MTTLRYSDLAFGRVLPHWRRAASLLYPVPGSGLDLKTESHPGGRVRRPMARALRMGWGFLLALWAVAVLAFCVLLVTAWALG
jgi:hypothetical protein